MSPHRSRFDNDELLFNVSREDTMAQLKLQREPFVWTEGYVQLLIVLVTVLILLIFSTVAIWLILLTKERYRERSLEDKRTFDMTFDKRARARYNDWLKKFKDTCLEAPDIEEVCHKALQWREDREISEATKKTMNMGISSSERGDCEGLSELEEEVKNDKDGKYKNEKDKKLQKAKDAKNEKKKKQNSKNKKPKAKMSKNLRKSRKSGRKNSQKKKSKFGILKSLKKKKSQKVVKKNQKAQAKKK